MSRVPSTPSASFPGSTRLKPRAFVGRVGRGVEVWEVEHMFIDMSALPKHFMNVGDAVMFAAFDRKKNLFIGSLDLRLLPIGRPCDTDLASLPVKHRARVFQVAGAALLPEYKKRGIGVALYIAGAAYAWRKGGYAIAADACFDSDTSSDARRVWDSRRFRQAAHVGPSGLVAVYRGGP